MKHISGFIFSLFVCVASFGQNNDSLVPKPIDTLASKTDTVAPKYTRHGLRVGIDLFKLTKGFYTDDYRGIEIVGDYRLTRSYFLAAEIGNEDKTTADDRLNFTTKGTYIKFGFDYNFYENWLDMENVITLGLRYGLSSFSQTLNTYKIYNPNNDYGQEQTIVSGAEFNGLTASWAEVAIGMKAEVLKNIYVGFSARLNYLISEKEPTNFANLYIPGFNRTYEGKFGVGFNYTVSYFIPIYKSKVDKAQKADGEKKRKK